MNITKTEALVLQHLAEAAGSERYGLQMVKQSDGALKMGTVYVILGRLEDKGFVESRREELEQDSPRSVPRRLYKISGLGSRTFAAYSAAMEAYQQGMNGDFAHV
ncbi:PadR family transcriptional regulator [Acidovorax sp.]|uniref:PadR family transcriptional regulator n=1 Tax=Acidovorax sp. TaxID=1872122 RepID=UPI002ACDFB87|nr:helix-turn-helix transcriptional regulator [Acidovorax sp.]MDZ7863525.1 helix-turn-helix transcriptional regulator [Acidovorax sp.]